MRIDIVVPQIGEAVSELTLREWYRREGAKVSKGDPLFSVDADKSVVEVEAFEDGVLEEIVEEEGAIVLPNQVVARIRTEDAPPEEEREDTVRPTREKATDADRPTASAARERATDADRPTASPKAKVVARRRGVSFEAVTGTGSRRMVTAADLLGAPEAPGAPGRLRAIIAERMVRSKREAPHFYLTSEVVMSAVKELREKLDSRPGYTAFILKAGALALRAVPDCNVRYSEGGPEAMRRIAIGVAVSVEGGVLCPVLHDVERTSLEDLTRRVKETVARVRSGRMREEEKGEKSMIVTNLGMYDVDRFAAIIDPGDAMILATGAIRDRVIAQAGTPVVAPTMCATLSVDHRLMDGVPAAGYLAEFKRVLESAEELV